MSTAADPAAAPRRMGRPPLDPAERARRAEAKAARAARPARGVAAHPLAHLAGRVPDRLLAAVIGASPASIRALRKRAGLPIPTFAQHVADTSARHAVFAALEPGGLCALRADAAAPLLRHYWGL
jgi:hypothetical protein